MVSHTLIVGNVTYLGVAKTFEEAEAKAYTALLYNDSQLMESMAIPASHSITVSFNV